MQKVKNKMAILETPGFNQVLFDALKVYILEARGEYRDDIEIAEMAMAVIESLKVSYRSPSNIPTKVKQVDLEDSIKEIKEESKKIKCSHPNIGTDGGGDYCKICGHRW